MEKWKMWTSKWLESIIHNQAPLWVQLDSSYMFFGNQTEGLLRTQIRDGYYGTYTHYAAIDHFAALLRDHSFPS